MAAQGSLSDNLFAVDAAWLARQGEPALEPDRPIIDPHHHFWDRPSRYLFEDLLADTRSGHNIRATVYMQCRSMYRADAPADFACIGETEFVNGVAAMSASGHYGPIRICAGIVGHVDLLLGAQAGRVLEAQVAETVLVPLNEQAHFRDLWREWNQHERSLFLRENAEMLLGERLAEAYPSLFADAFRDAFRASLRDGL